MAIAFVNSCSGAGTQNGVTSSAMDTTGANLIVVSVASYQSQGTNLTDSESNTWIALSLDSNSTSLERLYYCINPTTSSSHTFSFSQSATYPSISAIAFSGVSAFESENTSTQSGLSTTIQAGSVSPSVDGCLIIAGACSAGNGIYTSVNYGLTLETAIQHVPAVNMGSAAAYIIKSKASTVNPQFTSSTSHYLAASIAVFKPAKTGIGDEKLWLCPSLDDSADDISGNGNNGTYNGGMGTVADSSNGGSRAYSFDTSNTQRIDCPSSVMPLNQQSISMSCWAYIASHDSSYGEGLMGVWNYQNPQQNRILLFTGVNGYQTGEFGAAVRVGSTTHQAQSPSTDPPPPPTQTWIHLVAVLDNNVISLYKDGSLLSSTSFSGSVNGSYLYPFLIGTYNQGNTNHYLHGKMDDIRVFHRALTSTEITHLASARGVAGSPYGFKGLGGEKLWLCPTLDDSAEDISGNRHHGTYIAGMGTVADTSNGGTRAYSFNGTTHMLDVDSPPSITGPSASITYWCKSNDFASWRSPGGYVTNGYDDYRLTFRKSNQYLVVGYARYSTGGTRATDYYSLNNFSYTDWTHYAVVANEGDVYFYVDGVLAATATGGSGGLDLGSTFTLGSQDLRVGGSWWNGYIDDCRVYDRAITQEEVTHLAKSRGVLGSPYNLNGIVHLLSSFIHPLS